MRNRPNPSEHLYFIRIPNGPVKIGRTGNVKTRLRMLQCASPYQLELIGVLEGQGDQEGVWHNQFIKSRLCGEWFEWSELLEAAIKIAVDGGDWRDFLGIPRVPTWRELCGIPEPAEQRPN